MSVVLGAATCLTWVTRLTGAANEESLLAEIKAKSFGGTADVLPCLSGERTPHNHPEAQGAFL
jgi:xylulokinase